jgi:predicted GH43/DUF377 family glycosyl hydrolase
MKNFLLCLFFLALLLTQGYSQIEWTKHPDNPVLKRGPGGSWDDALVANFFNIYDGTLYHGWYSGYDGTTGTNIGYVYSEDGINWTKHPDPVLHNGPDGSWDNIVVYQPSVLFDGEMYHMWFAGHNGPGTQQIGYATSPDSINWTKYEGNPVLTPGTSGTWDDEFVQTPEVLLIDGVFHMWYAGYDGRLNQIGHATSVDGMIWAKDTENPVLTTGENGKWDYGNVIEPSVLIDSDSVYHMFYSGGVQFEWSTGYAYSMDGKNWIKYDSNPVLTPGSDGSWDDTFTGLACVFFNADSTGFNMWYTGGGTAAVEDWDIGYASASLEPVPFDITWYKYPSNPVYQGKSGEFDSNSSFHPAIIVYDNQYHMWYSGYDGQGNGSRVGYAVSEDGISWERHPDPVLVTGSGSSWDNFSVQQPTVLFDGTTWHMWYTGINISGLASRQIGYATSTDRINWTKHESNPVLGSGPGGSWDEQWVCWQKVLFVDGMYHMWYTGGNGTLTRIGHATSVDGVTWEKDPVNPVLTVGTSGSWDDLTVSTPTVSYDGHTFHMWYCGAQTAFGDWKVGYAVSLDGRHWEKISIENPVMDLGSSSQWDDKFVAHGLEVIIDDDSDELKMWYGGGRFNNASKIGFAQSYISTGFKDNMLNEIPLKPSLSQNYPNPFNPSTIINYELRISRDVELSVYNLLGQKVATLINGRQQAGFYQVEWDASGFASGVYYYRLNTDGGFVQTKKLILLR